MSCSSSPSAAGTQLSESIVACHAGRSAGASRRSLVAKPDDSTYNKRSPRAEPQPRAPPRQGRGRRTSHPHRMPRRPRKRPVAGPAGPTPRGLIPVPPRGTPSQPAHQKAPDRCSGLVRGHCGRSPTPAAGAGWVVGRSGASSGCAAPVATPRESGTGMWGCRRAGPGRGSRASSMRCPECPRPGRYLEWQSGIYCGRDETLGGRR